MMMPDIVYAVDWLGLQDEMCISEMQKFLKLHSPLLLSF